MFYFLWTTNQKVVTLEKVWPKIAVFMDIGEHTKKLEKVWPKISVAMDIGEHAKKHGTRHKRNSEVIT
jgi:hypothetical protein